MKYFFFILFLMPWLAFAEETSPATDLGTQIPVEAPTPSPNNDESSTSQNHYMIGLNSTNFAYEEPGLMKDNGQMNGVAFIFHRDLNYGSYFKIAADYTQGTLQYDGALQSNTGNTTPYSSTEQFRVINVEFILGRNPEDSTWNTYVDLGYRNTYDNKSGQYDYRRDITYYYLGAGLHPMVYSRNNLTSYMNFGFDLLMGGGAMTYLSDVSPNYKDVNFAFEAGLALKIGFENYIAIGKQKFLLDLTYKYWTLSQSKVEYVGNGSYGVEPKNHTGLASVTIAYIF